MVRSVTSVVRRNASIGSGLMNLAFVHGPAAHTLRHSPPDPRGRSVWGRAPALQVRTTRRSRNGSAAARTGIWKPSGFAQFSIPIVPRLCLTDGSDAHDEEARAARRQDRGNRATVVDAIELERMPCHLSHSRAISHAVPTMARATVCGGWPRQIGRPACAFVIEPADWRTAEPSFQSHDLPRWAVELLLHWSRASLGYLRHITELRHSAELASLLSLSRSPDYYGAEERACLLRNLIDDRESDAQRSARQAGKPGSRPAGTS